MTKRFPFFCAALLISTTFPGLSSAANIERSAAETLTLRTSLERAVKNNPRLQLAQKDFDIAKSQLRQARSLFFPRVSLNFDAVRYRQETLGQIPTEIGNVILETSRTSANQSSTTDNLYVGRLNLVQTLYAGGRVNYTHRLSRANLKRAQNTLETLQNQVELETAEAFFGLLAVRQKKQLAKDTLLDMEKLVRQSGSRHDKLAASNAQYEIRKNLSDIEQLEKDLRLNYLSAMGVEYFSEVKVDGVLALKPIDQDLETLFVWAKNNRSELKETMIQEEVDALSVDLSLATRYPVFRLGGGVEVRDREFPLNQSNWNAVLDMNIPIFDGLSSPARIRESRHRADQGRLRRSQLEDEVDAEVRSAYADIQHWTNELKSRINNQAELKNSERNYIGRKATEGISKRIEYLGWRMSRGMDVIDARLELCLANARMARALGTSILDQQ